MCLYIVVGSWVVTCGTESGVVRFIEEAVNVHVAMKNYHIPIVGILSQRVHDEMNKVRAYTFTSKILHVKFPYKFQFQVLSDEKL